MNKIRNIIGMFFICTLIALSVALPYQAHAGIVTNTIQEIPETVAGVFSTITNFFADLFSSDTTVEQTIQSSAPSTKPTTTTSSKTSSPTPTTAPQPQTTPVFNTTKYVTVTGPTTVVREYVSTGVTPADLQNLEARMIQYANSLPRGGGGGVSLPAPVTNITNLTTIQSTDGTFSTLTISTSTISYLNSGPINITNSTPAATPNTLYANSGDLYWAGNLIGGASTGVWNSNGNDVYRLTGNVGIGTTSPTYNLDINGSFRATGPIELGTTTISGALTVNGNTNITEGGQLTVGDKIIAPGEIGIGTSSPYSKLAVQSTLSTQTAFAIVGATGQTSPLLDIFNNPTSNQNLFRITAAGNVGVGTTDPGAKLDISGSTLGSSTIYITENSNTLGTQSGLVWRGYYSNTSTLFEAAGIKRISVDNSNSNTAQQRLGFFIRPPGSNQTLAESMSLLYLNTTNGPSLGIGTTSPAATIHAYSYSGLNSESPVTLILGSSNNSTSAWTVGAEFARLSFNSDDVSGVGKGTRAKISARMEDTAGSMTGLSFYTSNSSLTEAMRILSSGNVGIGTTSPYAKLAVAGNVVADNIWATSTTATNYFAGNVGIGAISPSEKLEIAGNLKLNAIDPIITLRNVWTGNLFTMSATRYDFLEFNTPISITVPSGGNTSRMGWFAQNNFGAWLQASRDLSHNMSLSFFTSSAGGSATEVVTIKPTGNVGIGTTSPYAKLSVAGDVVASNFNATSSYKINGVSVITYTGVNALTVGPLNTSTGNTSIAMGYSNSVPTAFRGAAVGYNNTINYGTEANAFGGSNIINGDNGQVFGRSNITNTSNVYIYGYNNVASAGGASIFGSGITNSVANSTMIGPSDSAKLTILSSGNVGIGTTSPASTLTVTGSACISAGAGATAACSTTAGTITANVFNTAAADLAERYKINDTSIEAGDVVALDPNNALTVIKATASNNQPNQGNQTVLGIISTDPGFLLGSTNLDDAVTRPVALAGRVPVKFSNENGEVKIGDSLTISATKPGYAMKLSPFEGGAQRAGDVIGTALENLSSDGKLTVFVRSSLTSGFVMEDLSAELAKSNASLLSEFADIISGSTNWMSARVSATTGFFKNVFADKVTTTDLNAKNIQADTGLTVKDHTTGELYCMYVDRGVTKTALGSCDTIQTEPQTNSVTPQVPPPQTQPEVPSHPVASSTPSTSDTPATTTPVVSDSPVDSPRSDTNLSSSSTTPEILAE